MKNKKLWKMIKEFLIIWACFEIYFENNLNTYKPLDFLDIKRLNPYYYKQMKGGKK